MSRFSSPSYISVSGPLRWHQFCGRARRPRCPVEDRWLTLRPFRRSRCAFSDLLTAHVLNTHGRFHEAAWPHKLATFCAADSLFGSSGADAGIMKSCSARRPEVYFRAPRYDSVLHRIGLHRSEEHTSELQSPMHLV